MFHTYMLTCTSVHQSHCDLFDILNYLQVILMSDYIFIMSDNLNIQITKML